MKTLEDYYKDKAFECTLKGDSFGASYWYQRAFEAHALDSNKQHNWGNNG